jgi:hypothetical protein
MNVMKANITENEVRSAFDEHKDCYYAASDAADILDKILKERLGNPPLPFGVWIWYHNVNAAHKIAKQGYYWQGINSTVYGGYWELFALYLNQCVDSMILNHIPHKINS